MVERHGRRVAAHFGSPPGEEAACLKAVGIADRSDRTTIEVRGDVDAALLALATLGERAWSTYAAPERALVRCEYEDAAACLAALGPAARDVTRKYAAIAVVGPNAEALLDATDFPSSAISLHESGLFWEVLVAPALAAVVWDALLAAGAPLEVACVGLDAIESLAASKRLRA